MQLVQCQCGYSYFIHVLFYKLSLIQHCFFTNKSYTKSIKKIPNNLDAVELNTF